MRLVKITVLGKVPAGLLRDCWPDSEEIMVSADKLPARTESIVGLRVCGNSMINSGINDGDLILIRRCETVESSQIAVVIINSEITLKRVLFDGGIILRAENESIPDQRVDSLTVFGVFVGMV